MTILSPYRIRLHRIGSRFPDRHSIDAWISSNGEVYGTVRNLDADVGFLPFSIQVNVEHVNQIRELWLFANCICAEPCINLALAQTHAELHLVKQIGNPDEIDRETDTTALRDLLESICQQAILFSSRNGLVRDVNNATES